MHDEINNSLSVLKKGGVILYPTDTIWGIGCDATDPLAVTNVYALKKRIESKALICLVSDIEMLESNIRLPDELEGETQWPYRRSTLKKIDCCL